MANVKEIVSEELDSTQLTPEKKQKILNNKIKSCNAFPEKTDDELIYQI